VRKRREAGHKARGKRQEAKVEDNSVRPFAFYVLPFAFCLAASLLHAQASKSQDWPVYGGGPDGTRYSTLKQINRSNVAKLKVAWSYDTGDGAGDPETQPIVVDGVLYGVTGKHNAFALDAATGRVLWQFRPGFNGSGPNRAVTYWAAGNDRRIFTTIRNYVYALDARTGQPIASFGHEGRIDLHEDLGRDPLLQSVALTSPGAIYKDLLIVGGRVSESLPASPGDIRAYDVRTGKLRWSFHTIPHPGEPGYETWPPDAWTYSGSANNWAGMAVDTERGIVYAPTGSAADDFNGSNRIGDNLYANCLLALDAATGRRLWHFQGVHHDLWDRDFPSPPSLVTVLHNGKRVEAVAQTTKQGWVFVFDRVTGQPLFPIEAKKYPPSDVPGEAAAETQSLPARPAPFARQLLTEDMLSTRTPAVHDWVVEKFRTFRSEGQFVPFSIGKETVLFPGFDGGAEWGGSAFDPQSGLLYVNANDVPWTTSLEEVKRGNSSRDLYRRQCASCHLVDMTGTPPLAPSLLEFRRRGTAARLRAVIREGSARMPAFPSLTDEEVSALTQYVLSGRNEPLAGSLPPPTTATGLKYRFTGYKHFLDPDGYPAVQPPWGTLNAINLNTGEYAWRIPLGEYPELAAAGLTNTGSENYGGPIVTAGGLLFIAATNYDKKFRAFDKDTGKLLWETTLPLSADATPATYEVQGRQYVVVFATNGKIRGNTASGVYVAFALP
jgi:quinoprotein glucose dehydrogenase